MVINGQDLLNMKTILHMEPEKKREHGVSYGLTEVGYDIRLKQSINFIPNGGASGMQPEVHIIEGKAQQFENGRFIIASSMEYFDMPDGLVGIVHDKSTWARQGLSVFNTVIEPGWKGYLTLELVFHGNRPIYIPAGSGIAQVIFHQTLNRASYEGKYQNQADYPVGSIFE